MRSTGMILNLVLLNNHMKYQVMKTIERQLQKKKM